MFRELITTDDGSRVWLAERLMESNRQEKQKPAFIAGEGKQRIFGKRQPYQAVSPWHGWVMQQKRLTEEAMEKSESRWQGEARSAGRGGFELVTVCCR